MRTTLEIDERLLADAMAAMKSRSKREAVEAALREVLRSRKRMRLAALIGAYDSFGLTLDQLEEMRREP